MSNSKNSGRWQETFLAIAEKAIRKSDMEFMVWDSGSGILKPIDIKNFNRGKGALLANEEYVTAVIFSEFYRSILRHGRVVDIGDGKKEYRHWDIFREVQVKLPDTSGLSEIDLLIVRCRPLEPNNYYRYPALIECKRSERYIAPETRDGKQEYLQDHTDVKRDVRKLLDCRSELSVKSVFFNKDTSKQNVKGFYLYELVWGECKDESDFFTQRDAILTEIRKKLSTTQNEVYLSDCDPNYRIFPKDNGNSQSFTMKSWNWILLIEIAPFRTETNPKPAEEQYWFQYEPIDG